MNNDTSLRDIEEDADFGITLSDGCRLSARLWKPKDAGSDPVPVILEYLPYRKRDGTCARDALTHPWFAERGYACLRVDMRGNGDSEGVMQDEYTPQELADAVEVINQIAAQDWCNGRVGMMGISWGGFNGLQVAVLDPAPLKAVITLCSTVDRYADDIHYKGGCLLNENLGWGSTMWAYSSRAPDPALRPDWRAMWLERLENEPFLPSVWLRHQRRDAYWEHGSVCEDFSAIKAKVLAVGGWGDAYKNAVPQLVEALPGAKGIVGPWVHKYPHFAVPEPRIGFLQEALRWWDRWLKDSDQPQTQIAVRLNHVHPDGATTRITYGVMNLSHRDGHANPSHLTPGEALRVVFHLDHIAYRLPKGHQLRVSVSTNYWPLIWPAPQAARITLHSGTMNLPVRRKARRDEYRFEPPTAAPPWEVETLREAKSVRRRETDMTTGVVSLIIEDDFGKLRDKQHGLIAGSVARERWDIHPDDPLSACGTCHWTEEIERDNIRLRTEAHSKMWCDADTFFLSARIEAYENDECIYARDVSDQIPRDHI